MKNVSDFSSTHPVPDIKPVVAFQLKKTQNTAGPKVIWKIFVDNLQMQFV